MLVLTRKINQTVVIDNRIRVTVLEIEGDKIKLGIDAPKEVPIVRQELYQAVEQENVEAARLNPGDALQIGELPKPKIDQLPSRKIKLKKEE